MNHSLEYSPKAYSKLVAIMMAITMVAGGFGEIYAPTMLLVPNDATATANNIIASELFYRVSFFAYLVEAMCDITIAMALFILLRPVHRNLALLALLFRVLSTATFAVSAFFYFAPSLILNNAEYMNSFTPEQINALSLLFFNFYSLGGGVFSIFYGIASVIFGILIYRSDYLPNFLGILLAIAGMGFVANSLLIVVAPFYATSAFFLPMLLTNFVFIFWFSLRGVDSDNWLKAARSE